MKIYYLFLSLASILSIGSAQSSADLVTRFDLAEQAFCGNKQISDDQLAEITNKCKIKNEQVTTLVKTCLKDTELSARKMLTAFCDRPTKECMVKNQSDKLATAKPNEIAEVIKKFDLYLNCVKNITNVQ